MPRFSQRSKDALKGVHPDLVRIMEAAIADTPVDFTIIAGVRTLAQQKAEYAKGRTVPGVRVTNADGINNKSDHQVKADGYGHAVDLYPFVGGKLLVTERATAENLRVIAKHIKATAARLGFAVDWGGNWKAQDLPHFALKR